MRAGSSIGVAPKEVDEDADCALHLGDRHDATTTSVKTSFTSATPGPAVRMYTRHSPPAGSDRSHTLPLPARRGAPLWR